MPDVSYVIEVSHIIKRFPIDAENDGQRIRGGFFYAIDDVSFRVERGACVLICGANGSGKSLLMSIIAALEAPDSGTARTCGRAGLIFQDADSQILGETPREDVAFGARNVGVPKNGINERVMRALAETGLEARADYPARSLSGGEKRRLAVAGVLAMDADIIIFDEPYANMDYPGVIQVNRQIQRLRTAEKTVIILTHEIEKCLGLADLFIALHQGKKVFEGSPAQALEQNLEAWGIHHPGAENAERLLWV